MMLLMAWMACTPTSTGLGTVTKVSEGVEGDPVLSWTPEELIIKDCPLNEARSGSVEISNTGDAALSIYAIELIGNDDIFFFEKREDLEFAPGVSDSYAVAATLTTNEPAEAQLRVTSNDLENRDLRVLIHAWPVGYVPPEDSGGSDSGGDSGG
ncbi:MAG TPA: hypothetical protein PKY30_05415 [Myxococcota bacterium]|nr:hypothetical protein [Myxococcota bacterium]HNH46451.1 hypothetical protein [Myxococcota bacterium]